MERCLVILRCLRPRQSLLCAWDLREQEEDAAAKANEAIVDLKGLKAQLAALPPADGAKKFELKTPKVRPP